jgi:hypothetical protein
MLKEMNWERVRNHFIVCGYGQVGRTVVEQLNLARIPDVLIETNQGLFRQLFQEGALVIHGDAKRRHVCRKPALTAPSAFASSSTTTPIPSTSPPKPSMPSLTSSPVPVRSATPKLCELPARTRWL